LLLLQQQQQQQQHTTCFQCVVAIPYLPAARALLGERLGDNTPPVGDVTPAVGDITSGISTVSPVTTLLLLPGLPFLICRVGRLAGGASTAGAGTMLMLLLLDLVKICVPLDPGRCCCCCFRWDWSLDCCTSAVPMLLLLLPRTP
jgi:hypothetical protein